MHFLSRHWKNILREPTFQIYALTVHQTTHTHFPLLSLKDTPLEVIWSILQVRKMRLREAMPLWNVNPKPLF